MCPEPLTIVAISDTHGLHRQLVIPPGDILICAGDITHSDNLADVYYFNEFLGSLPHPHKVLVAGNHDFCFEREPAEARALVTNAIYLEDQEATVAGLRIWGSPWQPWFFDWAFNLRRGPELKAKWDLIPAGIDILVTHGPPRGVGDLTWDGRSEGCEDLREAVLRVQPRLHVFGHFHEAHGRYTLGNTICLNASNCTRDYRCTNPPLTVRL